MEIRSDSDRSMGSGLYFISIGKFLYKTLIKRLGYNDFWHNEFYDFLIACFVASFLLRYLFEIGFIKHWVFDFNFTCIIFHFGQAACQTPEFRGHSSRKSRNIFDRFCFIRPE